MKPLSARHADRAQRKADNLADSNGGVYTDSGMGNAARLIGEAEAAMAGLTEAQREELRKSFPGKDNETDGFRSAVEDSDGSLRMASIGVVNPFVTPANAYTEMGASGVQADGQLPTASFDPANGNLNGAAVAAEGNGAGNGAPVGQDGAQSAETAGASGWGAPTPSPAPAPAPVAPNYTALSATELKAELDKRTPPVAYKANASRDTLIQLIENDDKAKAGAANSSETVN